MQKHDEFGAAIITVFAQPGGDDEWYH